MGYWDDLVSCISGCQPEPTRESTSFGLFGGSCEPEPEPTSFFGFLSGGQQSQPSQPKSLYDAVFGVAQPESSRTPVIGSGTATPILPTATQARGYGGQYFGDADEAVASGMMDGTLHDPYTGYNGTALELVKQYRHERRDVTPLAKYFRRQQ